MSVLLYAVGGPGLDPHGMTGLGDQPLRAIGAGGLRAVISEAPAPPPADIAHLWAYHATVMGLMAAAPVLPARFGTTAEDEREIKRMLVERQREFQASLTRVADRVEYAVSVPPVSQPEPPAASGTAYMERLRSRERSTQTLRDGARAFVHDARRTPHGTAYLVERDGAEAFVAQAGALGLAVVGPWPPYSFVAPA